MAAQLTRSTDKMIVDYGREVLISEKPLEGFCGKSPGNILHSRSAQQRETSDVAKLQEQAEQLERDLIRKEQETHIVLKQLEATRKIVEGLKAKFMAESSPPAVGAGTVLAELTGTRSNFSQASVALAMIQSSLESLNKKMRIDELHLTDKKKEKTNVDTSAGILSSSPIMNVDAEQLKKMKDASRCEVIKAMREIESTKLSIRMAEMRLNAAKKMEEAAKAVEAITLAQRSVILNADTSESEYLLQKPDGITKLIDRNVIVRKSHQKNAATISREGKQPRPQKADTRGIYNQKKTTTHEQNQSEAKNSRTGRQNLSSGSKKEWPSISMGAILSRKLMLQDVPVVKSRNHSSGQHFSLGQMLRVRDPTPTPSKPNNNWNVGEGRAVVQRNRYGFISTPRYFPGGSIKMAFNSRP